MWVRSVDDALDRGHFPRSQYGDATVSSIDSKLFLPQLSPSHGCGVGLAGFDYSSSSARGMQQYRPDKTFYHEDESVILTSQRRWLQRQEQQRQEHRQHMEQQRHIEQRRQMEQQRQIQQQQQQLQQGRQRQSDQDFFWQQHQQQQQQRQNHLKLWSHRQHQTLPEGAFVREATDGGSNDVWLPGATSAPSFARKADRHEKSVTCDKCDGPHETDSCPHFKQPREKHSDAWISFTGAQPPSQCSRPARVCLAPRSFQHAEARVVRMPADGACLFHALAHGLTGLGFNEDGFSVRHHIARYILSRADSEIAGTPLRSWIEWESRSSVEHYSSQIAGGHLWGGAIEMAATAQAYGVDVVVYEENRYGGTFFRISDFCYDASTPRGVVAVLYRGRSHYDALEPMRQNRIPISNEERQNRGEYPSALHRLPSEEDEWCSFM